MRSSHLRRTSEVHHCRLHLGGHWCHVWLQAEQQDLRSSRQWCLAVFDQRQWYFVVLSMFGLFGCRSTFGSIWGWGNFVQSSLSRFVVRRVWALVKDCLCVIGWYNTQLCVLEVIVGWCDIWLKCFGDQFWCWRGHWGERPKTPKSVSFTWGVCWGKASSCFPSMFPRFCYARGVLVSYVHVYMYASLNIVLYFW